MGKPVELYRNQMNALLEVEKQRLADLSFAEIKVLLLNNQIPWDKLPSKKDKKIEYPLPPAIVQIPHSEPRTIERSFVILCKGEKISKSNDTIRLFYIEVKFLPYKEKGIKYRYRAIAKKSNAV